MIGIIGAMPVEIESLLNKMKNKSEFIKSNIKYIKGKIENKECVVAQSGPGKVNAAICAQTMILEFSPDYIINTGVAGSMTNNLHISDIAIAINVAQHDIDTSAIGDPIGLIPGINIRKIPCSKYLINLAINSLNKMNLRYSKGTILTGDQFINNMDRKKYLKEVFDGIACEMEGGSIGQVCYINDVKFIVIRSISDGANQDSACDYEKFVKISAEKSCELVLNLIKEI